MAREYHGDGSYTDRYSDGTSVTSGPGGDVRESTRNESSNPLSIIPIVGDICDKDLRVTRDSDGNVTKVDRNR